MNKEKSGFELNKIDYEAISYAKRLVIGAYVLQVLRDVLKLEKKAVYDNENTYHYVCKINGVFVSQRDYDLVEKWLLHNEIPD